MTGISGLNSTPDPHDATTTASPHPVQATSTRCPSQRPGRSAPDAPSRDLGCDADAGSDFKQKSGGMEWAKKKWDFSIFHGDFSSFFMVIW